MSTTVSSPPPTYHSNSESGDLQWNPESNIQHNAPAMEWIDLTQNNTVTSCNASVTNIEMPPLGIPTNHRPEHNGHNEQLCNIPAFLEVPDRNPTSNGFQINGSRVLTGNNNDSNVMIQHRAPNVPTLNQANGWMTSHRPQARFITRSYHTIRTPNGIVRKPKRIRTAFTSRQMMDLEQEYARTRYLDRSRRIELATSLHLNERTIKIWFQNRRMKEKKDKAESLEESEEISTTTQSSPELCDSVPMLVNEEYQAIANNFNHGIYTEQYQLPSTSMMSQSISNFPQVSQVPGNLMSSSSQGYTNQVQYESQRNEIHQQLQQYVIYNNDVQQPRESTQNPSMESPANGPQNGPVDANWDISWIRSVNIEEDFQ